MRHVMRKIRFGAVEVHLCIDLARDHTTATQILPSRALRCHLAAVRIDRHDALAVDRDGHAQLRRSTGAIDDRDVSQQQKRRDGEHRYGPCAQQQ